MRLPRNGVFWSHPDIGLERHEPLRCFGLALRDRVARGRPDRNARSLGHVGDKANGRAEEVPDRIDANAAHALAVLRRVRLQPTKSRPCRISKRTTASAKSGHS